MSTLVLINPGGERFYCYIFVSNYDVCARLTNERLEEREKRIIRADFVRIHTMSKDIVAKLEEFDDKEIGIELLHVWFRDLLGPNTTAGKIFQNKCGLE